MSKSVEELAKEKRNEYMREWRRRNREKVKEYNVTHWKNKVKKELEEKNS